MAEWPDIANAVVAGYAATLATYTYVMQRLEKRPQVRSSMDICFLASALGDTSDPLVSFTAVNTGERPVTLTGHFIRLPNKEQAIIPIPLPPGNRLPYELQPGNNCTLYCELKEFAHSVRNRGLRGTIKIVSIFRDATGRTYKGKPYLFDVDEWTKGE